MHPTSFDLFSRLSTSVPIHLQPYFVLLPCTKLLVPSTKSSQRLLTHSACSWIYNFLYTWKLSSLFLLSKREKTVITAFDPILSDTTTCRALSCYQVDRIYLIILLLKKKKAFKPFYSCFLKRFNRGTHSRNIECLLCAMHLLSAKDTVVNKIKSLF